MNCQRMFLKMLESASERFYARIFSKIPMKKILAALLFVVIISSFSSVYAEPILLEQLSSSGKVLVKLEWPEVYPDEIYKFKVSFYDPNTGELLDDIRLNYNIIVSQRDHEVEVYEHNLATDGTGEFDVMFPQESEGPAEIIVDLRAASDNGHTIKYEEEVKFAVNVVPEFGVIVAILAAAFIPILLLSKSKLMTKI